MEAQLLGLVLLLLFTAQHAPAIAIPNPRCQTQCGGVEIPYPFGVGLDCSLALHFNVSCEVRDGFSKPILSDVHNKFTVIGCYTLAYIGYDLNSTRYQSGCVSTCHNLSDLADGSCTGIGCCQTAIPKGMDLYFAGFDNDFNTSQIWTFSRCSYAVLMEAEAFNFSKAYITTTEFNDTSSGQVPVVVDWAIRNGSMSCDVAKQNKEGTYACLSKNSDCVDSLNGPGYLCNCSKGYEGNPYRPDGCHALGHLTADVDECKYGPCPSGGKTHFLTVCSYLTIYYAGVTVGFLVLVIFSFFGHMILQKRTLNQVKQEHFREHGGMILFERMRSERGLAFTVFSEAELIQATNNYDKSTIIGQGGHGTVYKGIVKGNMLVAIKRCALIDERQKKEFGQEMLILSQINHKNIVKLVGCCLEVEVPMLVYEFIPNGTLFELIHGKNQALQISFSSLLRIVHEADEGLNILHSYASPPIIHGDVKTANILLDENYMAKMSDFGASILAPSDKEQYVTMVQGTCGYLDPEYMQTCQLTEKSDVYSFGVILLEVLTGQEPLTLDGPETQRSLSSKFLIAMKENNLDSILPNLIKGQESNEFIRGLAELAKQCLDMSGSNRPSMKEIADELGRLRKLSQHPWAQLYVEMDTRSLLDGALTASFQIEGATTGYPTQEGEDLPMNPRSSYYAR
ncbi:hypothetical protein HU200_031597 [Digitaria exilis]|uniref:Protein kinase domain-containing protein n=1 Tax=Digitaria exilis TaxID=1010633 RepID=A0A835C0T8_9POAL|nr:hypothetical protein HU200_031597 [Digitaria exilis]